TAPEFPTPPLHPPFPPVPPIQYPPYKPSNEFVPDPSPFSDADLRRAVRNQLAAHSLLHKAGIRSDVREGVVILTGTADTWQDYARAAADAYAAGARAVDNRLRVRFP